jgi:cysteine desulfurase / selenocysteine lyase
MSASTMSTSDPPLPGSLPSGAQAPLDPAAMTAEIARLANQFFSAAPNSPADGPGAVAAALPASPHAAPPLVAPAGASSALPGGGFGAPVPPRIGPSAAALGAGGLSSASSLPPTPGFLQQPPIASAPLLRESDLRPGATMLADQAGLSSPAALAPPSESGQSPYFLGLAGLPTAVPGGPSAAVPPGGSSLAPPPSPVFPATFDAPGWTSLGALNAPLRFDNPSRPGLSEAPGLPATAPVVAVSPEAASPARAAYVTPASAHDPLALGAGSRIFDPHVLKRDFPILQERVHGKQLVWLDNAATTQKPNTVIERLSHFYRHENSNIHRAAHELAARATDAYEGARTTVARFLHAPSPKDIVFTRGATEAINLVAQAWGRRNVAAGDEIVITHLEHHANIVPWQMLAAEKGAKLRVAPVDSTGQVILEEYEKLLGPRTRLVSLTQVSNALGTVTPAKDMVAMAHRHGARVLVDGAQAVLHMPVDVQDLDCDFYVFSGHKIFAPTGIGVLYGKSQVLEAMPPWQGGGNMIQDVTFEKTSYQSPPFRFEAGTGNIADAVGLGAALDYVTAVGIENIQRYEHEMLVYGTERLSTVPGLRLIGTAAEKAGVFSFVIDGLRTEDIGGALDQEGIAVRSGHHCAQPILRRFGVENSVRASLALYNGPDDLDALVAALLRLTAGRPR